MDLQYFFSGVKIVLCGLLCMSIVTVGWAQVPDNVNTQPNGTNGTNTPNADGSGFQVVPPDSVPIYYFHAANPSDTIPYADTLLGQVHQFDPGRHERRQSLYFDRYNLGAVGLPSSSFLYEPIVREGFHLGFNQYRTYTWRPENVRYYFNPKAYTEASYSQTGSQNEFVLEALASVNFSKHMHAAIDFRRIRQEGEYQQQSLKHGNVAVTLWYHSPEHRYRTYISYLVNNFFNQNNGGIQDITALDATGTFSARSNIAVNLSGAETDYRNSQLSITSYLPLRRQPKPKTEPVTPPLDSLPFAPLDSASLSPSAPTSLPPVFTDTLLAADSLKIVPPTTQRKNKADLLLMHQFAYETRTYKFFDSSPPTDSAVYGDLMVDTRGLRQFIAYQAIENALKVRLSYMGNLDVGLRYKVFNINQEPKDTTIQNLFLMGDWVLDTDRDNIGLQVKARLGLLDNGADYLLDAKAYLQFRQLGRLEGRLLSQRYSPALVQHRLFISQQSIWENNFAKPLETSLMASLYIPKTQTRLQFQNHLLNNFIYYDTASVARQTTTAINLLQFLVTQNFKFGIFHWHNTVGFQQNSNTNLLRFPSLISKHSLFLEGFIFKRAALTRLGVDIRYNSNFQADNYQPATGQFILQNQVNITYPPLLDAYFSAKVQTLRIYIKAENLNELLFSDLIFNTATHMLYAPNHPSRNWTIRAGLHWRFYD